MMTTTIEVFAARGRLTWALARAAGAALILLAVLLSACGGGGAPPPTEGSATLGAAGGHVDGPDGVRLAIGPGALARDVTLRIARNAEGAPATGDLPMITPVYQVTPHGQLFEGASALLTIPFDATRVPAGGRAALMRADPGGRWEWIADAEINGGAARGSLSGLSYYTVVACAATDICANSSLRVDYIDANTSQAVPVANDPVWGYTQPLNVLPFTAPTTVRLRITWTRPSNNSRSDGIFVSTEPGWTVQGVTSFEAPAGMVTFQRDVLIDVNPAAVVNASQNTVLSRVLVRASGQTTYFCFGPGFSCTSGFDIQLRPRWMVRHEGSVASVTVPPSNASVVDGSNASFSASASGPGLSYQWLRSSDGGANYAPIGGATAASYSLTPATLADNGARFAVEVCSASGTPPVTRRPCPRYTANLTVTARAVLPTFTTVPQSITVTEGETASFSAVANGQPAPTMTWTRIDGNGQFVTFVPVCTPTTGGGSVTSATCSLGVMTLANNGQRFSATATNTAGATASAVATLTVLARPVGPTITSTGELRDQTVTEGGSATWNITATGTGVLGYTWYTVDQAGNPLNGLTCGGFALNRATPDGVPTLTVTNVPVACNGARFVVRVGNSVGLTLSRIGTLTVHAAPAAPQISTPLANRSVLDGTPVTFTVAATGTPATFSHGWTLDGAAVPEVISGCTTGSASCSFTARLNDTGKTVAVTVANGVAPNAQSSAVLTVTTTDVPASITTQPTSQSVVAGNTATFTIGTAGTPTPAVQWQTSTDGTNWTDAGTGASHVVSNAQTSQNGLRVRAVVTNTTRVVGGTRLNSVTSSTATLTVVDNVPVNALTAVQLTTLGNRTMALRADGSVYAWGNYVDPVHGAYHTAGQFARAPTRVLGLGAVRQIAIGSDYASWALGQDGTVWGWGFLNSYQAFAQGPNDPTLQFYTPVRILEAANTPIDRVCAIEGTIFGVVMVRSDVIGGTCAANEPRSVWYTANIANSEGTSVRYAQRFNLLNSGGTLLPSGRWITQVLTSRNHGVNANSVFALANDGSVYAWGYVNNAGQLGLGITGGVNTPTLAPGWAGATRIAAGSDVTLALMPDGTVRGAGWNTGGSLGIGPVSNTVVSTPQTLSGINGAIDVGTSYQVSMALVGGDLRYWGIGGRFVPGQQPVPIPIAAPVTPFSAVAVGSYVAFAIGPGGAVYGWGDATYSGCGAFNVSTCNNPTTSPQLLTISP